MLGYECVSGHNSAMENFKMKARLKALSFIDKEYLYN